MTRSLLDVRRRLMFVALAAGATAGVGDWLFFAHPVGWTAGLFLAWVTGVVLWKNPHLLSRRAGVVVLGAIAGLVLAMVEQPDTLPILMAIVGW